MRYQTPGSRRLPGVWYDTRMFYRRIRRRRKARPRSKTQQLHYLEHKEAARRVVLVRLEHFNQHYGLTYGRVSIKCQRRCWGSCSSLGNLNFNYRILFLPPELQDYIIVHELCHLAELNHGPQFWQLVAQMMPQYQQYKNALKVYEGKVVTGQLEVK